MASRRYILRGCRTKYIPGLSEESKSLYEEYKKHFDNGTIETGTYEQHERRGDGRRSLHQPT